MPTYTVWIVFSGDHSNYVAMFKNKADADSYVALNPGLGVAEGRISQAWFVDLTAVPLA